jgi:L-fucose isomerase-like protein
MKTQTFALYFGTRGFFPEKLIAAARRDMRSAVEQSGYKALMMDATATPYGAVEGAGDGRKYAAFLAKARGTYDGVIVCLPNFGDETGAITALRDAGVPILVQAYPDELDKMDFANRRDAFCGKFSVMDVFCQYGVPFTTFAPHTVHPRSAAFSEHLHQFAAVCRIVNKLRRLTVGAIGARTTAFKAVRFDELTLQRYGITVETLDLSDIFLRMRDVKTSSAVFRVKERRLRNYTSWRGVPAAKFKTLVKLGIVIDELIAEYDMDCLALRCWLELEREFGIAPCVILSEINDRGIAAACELDVCNAVAMCALGLASQRPSTCLDWNNNYGDEPDKCILFHCGPVPRSLMAGPGRIVDHPMFAKTLKQGCGIGCNVGRIAPSAMTFASSKTTDGKLSFYLGQGEFTDDPIADDFFGCAGVAHVEKLQHALEFIGHAGYRHHVGVTAGHVAQSVHEALTRYFGIEVTKL